MRQRGRSARAPEFQNRDEKGRSHRFEAAGLAFFELFYFWDRLTGDGF
jgi:hypothetical protein